MQPNIQAILNQINKIILGKDQQIKLSLACLFAGGHLLIEDMPGMGKTTLAHTLAQILGLQFQRVQFTSDLLPADMLGVSVYDANMAQFTFHPGPVFTNVLLADEINRATPKTQSALLEVMEEAQITVDRQTYPLPQPFFVIATQNPSSQIGTFALPESQLDRFLMRIQLGYPDADAERQLLQPGGGRAHLHALSAITDGAGLQAIQAQCRGVYVSDQLLDYIQAILKFTRESQLYMAGLSPRAGLSLKRCAQAWALIAGRDFVMPEDVQAILPSVAGHRLQSRQGFESQPAAMDALNAIAVP